MKCFAFSVALFLAVAPARGEDGGSRLGGDFTALFGGAREVGRLAALLQDDVLRELVCRLSSERYTFGALSLALGVPEGQVARRVNVWRDWGLIRTVARDSSVTLVEPLPGGGCREPEPDAEIASGVDPQKILREGREQPREVYASKRRSFWLEKLSPGADPLLQIATQAEHSARWDFPRSKYPTGKVGFNAWRRAMFKFHAEKTAEILADLGYSAEQIDRVASLVQWKGLARDLSSRLLRDVASLVFLENDLEKLAAERPQSHLIYMVQRTWRKMSVNSRQRVREFDVSSDTKRLIDTALGDDGAVRY